MAAPAFSMRQLLEAGVHFGHSTRRWNPRMKPFIFGERNGIHILDLQQTMPLFGRALEAMRDTAAKGGRILFVGTKRAAAEKILESQISLEQKRAQAQFVISNINNLNDLEAEVDGFLELVTTAS